MENNPERQREDRKSIMWWVIGAIFWIWVIATFGHGGQYTPGASEAAPTFCDQYAC